MNLPWLEPAWRQFIAALDADRLGHALLVHGPAGLGKSRLADDLAARLLCLQPGDGACGECRSCTMLASGIHPDRVILEPAEDEGWIRVDDVRELNHGLQLTARLSPARVALVRRAERMNINAANALLKTLEEPPPGAWLILITDQPGRLPVTIRSRCLPVSIRPPDNDTGLAWLAACELDADAATRERALALAGGAPLAARDWIADGDMAFGEQVLATLARPTRLLDTARTWSENAGSAWSWCARWCARALHARVTGEIIDDDIGRLARCEPQALIEAYDAAVTGLSGARGPTRQDLRLADWLLQWQRKIPR